MKKRKRRLRPHPVQIYLSSDELDAFDELVRERGVTRAEQVRRWIGKAKPRGSKKAKAYIDPRQLELARAIRESFEGLGD